jgi:hypothetical protein
MSKQTLRGRLNAAVVEAADRAVKRRHPRAPEFVPKYKPRRKRNKSRRRSQRTVYTGGVKQVVSGGLPSLGKRR